MAQGDQVKNGKAFEYALASTYTEKLQEVGCTFDNYFTYKGIRYPYKTIVIKDSLQSSYIIVSVKELEDKLIDENGAAYDKKAESIDNKIAYYLNTIDDLKRSDNNILEEIYS